MTMEDLAEFASCKLVYGAEEDGEDQDEYAEAAAAAMYIVFHCTEDGGITLSAFSYAYCTYFYQGAVSIETAVGKTLDHGFYGFLYDGARYS